MKNLFLISVLVLLFSQCKKDDPKPKPIAGFLASNTQIKKGESVQFTDESINTPTTWSWDFGDGSTSAEQNPTHVYASPGTYTVSLTVSNSAGEDVMERANYITVLQTTDVHFISNVYTKAYITLNSIDKTVEPGDTVTYEDVSGETAIFSGYTYGKNTVGDMIGVRVDWGTTLELEGGNNNVNLNVGGDKFFIFMQNNGTRNLENLYVNYGLSDQTQNAVSLPADGVLYRSGYFNAHDNTQVRMLWESDNTMYVYWDQGTHFSLDYSVNQHVILTYNGKKSFGDNNIELKNSSLLKP